MLFQPLPFGQLIGGAGPSSAIESSRFTPNQFAEGLDISATRMQQDLVALAARYNATLPSDIARRWMETHMTAGFLPNLFPPTPVPSLPETPQATPQALPWMGVYNSALETTAPSPDPATIINPWRAKGTHKNGIDAANRTLGNILSWETSFSQTGPFLLDSLQITLATDSFYSNPFVYGSNPPAGKSEGQPVDDLTLEIIVDSALATENREAATMPLLRRSFPATVYDITQPDWAFTDDPIVPPMYDPVVPYGMCIVVTPLQPIPENARVRLILSVPVYDRIYAGATDNRSTWGYTPWQTFVLSSHITLMEPVEAM